MNKKTLISVIVPIYNMEHLLKRALDSVLAQTFVEWECLLIDDGSTDGSPQICDEYAKKDSRFRVFHKKNGGVSSARQCGIDNALGTFSIHMDPDDWIDCDMLESLFYVAETNDADMVICDFMIETKCGLFRNKQEPGSLNHYEIMKQLLSLDLHGSCCNKLIRHSCYTKNNIFFPSEMIMWEDLFVCCRLLQNDIKVTYLPEPFYHYDRVSNGASVVSSASRKKVESKKYLIEFFESDYRNIIDFYQAKKDIKLGMLRLLLEKPKEIQKDEIINTYAEINQRLLEDLFFSFRQPLNNSLRLLISGRNIKFIAMYFKIHQTVVSLLLFIKYKFFRKIA